ATIDAQGIRDEKVKALRAVDILTPAEVAADVVRAQYDRGWIEGEQVAGYCEEDGVAPTSTTETYLAMRLRVDNWRWAGVPVYVRTGKRLPKRYTEVALEFHEVPHLPFTSKEATGLGPNALVLRIQPDEGISLRFGAKVPGGSFRVRSVSMDFSYGAAFLEETPEAYERLLLDAMLGDPTLFIRSDEVEQAWRIVDPVLEAWAGGAPSGRGDPAHGRSSPRTDHRPAVRSQPNRADRRRRLAPRAGRRRRTCVVGGHQLAGEGEGGRPPRLAGRATHAGRPPRRRV